MFSRLKPLHRRALLAGGVGATLTPAVAFAKPAPLVLERPLLDGTVRLEGSPRFAGAVSSLTFREMEYVDAVDHGRLFQSAIHFDGLGECLNPTQGGASSDEKRTTSRLEASLITADVYAVTTRMAYWLRPGQSCTLPGRGKTKAANPARRSDVTVDVAHGFGALPARNAVGSVVRFTTDWLHDSAVVEALTVYTPAAFNTLYAWRDGALTRAEAAAEQPTPYVLATGDGAHAIALFTPRGAEPARFGGFSYGRVGKLNAVFRPEGRYAPGVHAYRLAWAIGTLDEVGAALAACS